MSEKTHKKSFLNLLIIVFMIIISCIFIIVVYKDTNSSLITDKRFNSGYTEYICELDGNNKNIIINPAKYELQIDGKSWIEVTENEYSENHIGNRWRKLK